MTFSKRLITKTNLLQDLIDHDSAIYGMSTWRHDEKMRALWVIGFDWFNTEILLFCNCVLRDNWLSRVIAFFFILLPNSIRYWSKNDQIRANIRLSKCSGKNPTNFMINTELTNLGSTYKYNFRQKLMENLIKWITRVYWQYCNENEYLVKVK